MPKTLPVKIGLDALLDPQQVKVNEKEFTKKAQAVFQRLVKNLHVSGGEVRISGDLARDTKDFSRLSKQLRQEAKDTAEALNLYRQAKYLPPVEGGVKVPFAERVSSVAKPGTAQRAIKLAQNNSEQALQTLFDYSKIQADYVESARKLNNSNRIAQRALEKYRTDPLSLTDSNRRALGANLQRTEQALAAAKGVYSTTKTLYPKTSEGEIYQRTGVDLKGIGSTINELTQRLTELRKAASKTAFEQKQAAKEQRDYNAALASRLKQEAFAGPQINSKLLAQRQTGALGPEISKEQLARNAAYAQQLEKMAATHKKMADLRKTAFGTEFYDSAGAQRGIAALNSMTATLRKMREEAVKAGKTTKELRNVDNLLDKISRRKAQLSSLSKEFKKMEGGIRGVSKASKELNPHLGQSSLLVRQFFRYALGYGALYRILGLIGQLTSGVLELNKALYSIKAVTAATNEEMTKISSSIKEVAVQTKYTTTEVAKAAQVLSQAGVAPEELNSVLNAVSTFASGTESSIEVAADLVSTMRNVFRDLDDLTIANQLTKAVNISKLTAEDLKTILGISAQVSKSFNLTSEQYLSAVTTLRNAGLKASTVATGLRQGLLEIFSPDSKSIKDLKQRYADLGEAVSEQELRTRFFKFTQEANPLLAVLRELDRLGFNGEGRKTLARSLDIRAANAIRALIDNIDELEKSETRLVFGNSALEASATQMDSLSNSIDNLGAAMTVLATDITEGPISALEDLVDAATEAVQALDRLHIESLAKGGEGLSTALQTGAAGAITGAVLGRTPAQRFALGAAGAGLGGYAGVKLTEGDNQAAAASAADLALMLSIVVPLFGSIGRAITKYMPKISTFKVGAAAAKLTSGAALLSSFFGSITKVTDLIGKIVGAVKPVSGAGLARLAALPGLLAGLGVRLLPFVGWAYTAYEVATLIADIGNKNKPTLEQLKNQLKGAQRQAVKAEQDAKRAEEELSIYKFTDLSGGFVADPGKAAGQIEKLQERADDLQYQMQALFGDIIETDSQQLLQLLRDLRARGTQEGSTARQQIVTRINEVAGTALETNDENLIRVANGYSELLNAVKGVNEDLVNTIRRTSEDLENGSEVDAARKGAYQAFTEIVNADADFIDTLFGGKEDIPIAETLDKVRSLMERAYEVGAASNQLVQKQDDELTKRKAEIDKAFAIALASNEPSAFASTVNKLIANAKLAGRYTTELLQYIEAALEDAQNRLQLETESVSRRIGTESNARRRSRSGRSSAEELAARQDVIASKAVEADVVSEGLATARKALDEAVATYNRQTTEAIAEALDEVAFNAPEILRDNPELRGNKSLMELFDVIDRAASNDKLDGLLQALTGIVDFQGKVVKTPLINELLKLGPYVRGINASVPDSQGSHGRNKPEALSNIPDPARFVRMKKLEEQIEKAEKKNLKSLVDINDALNPIVQLRNEQLAEAREELAVAKENFQNVKNFYSGDLNSEDAKKKRTAREAYNKAELELRKAELKIEEIRSEARKQTTAARIKLDQEDLEYAKRRVESEKNALEQQIKAAVAAGDTEGLQVLQNERLLLSTQILDIDKAVLGLQEEREDVIKQIDEANRKELDAAQRAADAQEYIAAIREQLKYSQGDFTTGNRGRDAYLSSVGFSPSRENEAASLAPQLAAQKQALVELRAEYARVVNESGNTSQGAQELADEIDTVGQKVYELTGKLEGLTDAATFDYQLEKLTDLGEFNRKLQGLNSDISKLGDNIQNRFVNGIDQIGEALTDAAIAGTSFKESVKSIFYDVFRGNAVDYAKTAINSLFQAFLPKQTVPQAPSIPEAAGLEGLFGEQYLAAIRNNTIAIEANTVANGGTPAGVAGAVVGGVTGAASGGAEALGDIIADSTDKQIAADSSNTEKTVKSTEQGLVAQGGFWQQVIGLLASIGNYLLVAATGTNAGGWGQVFSSVASWFGAKGGKANVQAYGSGGTIKGPGTGKSDDIPAIVLDKSGRPARPIAVSNGESILTAKATQILGEDFINRVNAMQSAPAGFATGGIFGKIRSVMRNGKKGYGNDSLSQGLARAIQSVGVGGGESRELQIVMLDDRKAVEEIMMGPMGEKSTLVHINRNGQTVKAYTRG